MVSFELILFFKSIRTWTAEMQLESIFQWYSKRRNKVLSFNAINKSPAVVEW